MGRVVYEKVVKVKADVAAILNFFSRPSLIFSPTLSGQIEVDHLGATQTVSIGGWARGGFQRSGLKPPLRRSRGIGVCQRFLRAHSVPAAWGEPTRPGFPPRETGKGEFKLRCCRRHFGLAWHRCQARRSWIVRSLFSHVFRQIPIPIICRLRRSAFQNSCWPPPTACHASIRTLNGLLDIVEPVGPPSSAIQEEEPSLLAYGLQQVGVPLGALLVLLVVPGFSWSFVRLGFFGQAAEVIRCITIESLRGILFGFAVRRIMPDLRTTGRWVWVIPVSLIVLGLLQGSLTLSINMAVSELFFPVRTEKDGEPSCY